MGAEGCHQALLQGSEAGRNGPIRPTEQRTQAAHSRDHAPPQKNVPFNVFTCCFKSLMEENCLPSNSASDQSL